MMKRVLGAAALAASLTVLTLAGGCTGGKEGTAAEEQLPAKNGVSTAEQPPQAVDPRSDLDQIGHSIPLYAGARYREDLTRRDAVMVRNQYGPNAKVYTLATDDSFPQVYHYYTTYLAQFRAFPAQNPYPPEQQNWRTLEVPLNQVMQDPFIPGEALPREGRQVLLQVAETEAEPKTVIRYIVMPAPPAAVATANPGPAAATPGSPVQPAME